MRITRHTYYAHNILINDSQCIVSFPPSQLRMGSLFYISSGTLPPSDYKEIEYIYGDQEKNVDIGSTKQGLVFQKDIELGLLPTEEKKVHGMGTKIVPIIRTLIFRCTILFIVFWIFFDPRFRLDKRQSSQSQNLK